jgi:hypothetical protein
MAETKTLTADDIQVETAPAVNPQFLICDPDPSDDCLLICNPNYCY